MAENLSVHTLVFDLDDTLFLEAEYALSGISAAERWLENHYGPSSFGEIARSLFNAGVRRNLFNQTLEQMGWSGSSPVVPKLVAAYREHRPTIRLLDDAQKCLDWARSMKIRLGLITDGYAVSQRMKIAALGLSEYFDSLVLTDEIGRAFWKPHPAAFLKLMGDLQGDPAGFVYIGDNPTKDFAAPKNIGWRTIRIRRERGQYLSTDATIGAEAEEEISLLTDLPGLI